MAKDRELPALSGPQLDVVRAIWDRGEASVTEVWKDLEPRKPMARGTVQTTIQRLAARGWLEYREVGQTRLYSVCRSREEFENRQVADLLASTFDGSAAGLVRALVQDRRLGAEEAERIRELIASAEKKPRRRGGER